MSNYYGIFCKTCETSNNQGGINHGRETVEKIIRIGPYLAEAIKHGPDLLEVRVLGDDGVLQFAIEHDQHMLWVEDEYGKAWDKQGVEWNWDSDKRKYVKKVAG